MAQKKDFERGCKDGSEDAWSRKGERNLDGKSDDYVAGYDYGFDEAVEEMHTNGLLD